jgi:hypothetical protein
MTADTAEQLAWQRRAHAVLRRLLDLADAGDPLPVAAWTVASAGCQVTGRFLQAPPGRRRGALTAWADALGADVRQGAAPSGRVTVSAVTRSDEDSLVRIVLVADIWDAGSSDTGP